MYIHEAITEALTKNACIKLTKITQGLPILIRPTNSPECCEIINCIKKEKVPHWNPQAGDLISSNWEVSEVDTTDFKTVSFRKSKI